MAVMSKPITRVVTDAGGETFFATLDLQPRYADDGALQGHAIANISTTTASIVGNASRSAPGWHPAPRRQFIVLLQGEYEITVGSGESKRFTPGDVVLVEDVDGTGHVFTNLSGDELTLMAVGITSDWSVPTGSTGSGAAPPA